MGAKRRLSSTRCKKLPGPVSLSLSKSGPVTWDHLPVSDWPEHPVSQFISDPRPEFAKFKAWIERHPDTQSHFTLREVLPDAKNPSIDIVKQVLKAQILDGFSFLLACDKALDDYTSSVQLSMPEGPFPDGRHMLHSVQRLWRQCLQLHFTINILKQKSRERVSEAIAKAKRSVSDLMSLLASCDAVPRTFLAVVNFKSFSIQPTDLVKADSVAQACEAAAERTRIVMLQTLDRISEIRNTHERGGHLDTPEAQMTFLHAQVRSWSEHCDLEHGCLKIGCDPIEFFDFFSHPVNSITSPLIVHFLKEENQTLEGAKAFIERIIGQFNFRDEHVRQVVNALVSTFLGPRFTPPLKFDGPGTDDTELLSFALDLVIILDPTALLGLIGDAGIHKAADALKTITSSWKDLLQFVYTFTWLIFLNQRMNTVRSALGQFLQS
jgi:hypothetical protein